MGKLWLLVCDVWALGAGQYRKGNDTLVPSHPHATWMLCSATLVVKLPAPYFVPLLELPSLLRSPHGPGDHDRMWEKQNVTSPRGSQLLHSMVVRSLSSSLTTHPHPDLCVSSSIPIASSANCPHALQAAASDVVMFVDGAFERVKRMLGPREKDGVACFVALGIDGDLGIRDRLGTADI
ncbi:hypothetical protein HD554DRAFT_2104535 [Boletus coccyginus]|nr:hypothetical protein HD554DRAFT_2104535 [Boletus coccyginus]